MPKKFRLPPPDRPTGKHFELGLNDPSFVAAAMKHMEQSGLLTLFNEIAAQLVPYVESRVKDFDTSVLREQLMSKLEPALDLLILLYVGRRAGTLDVRFHDSAGGRPANDIGVAMSQCLNELGKLLGEKQAAQVFRRLEKITDEVLQRKSGRSK